MSVFSYIDECLNGLTRQGQGGVTVVSHLRVSVVQSLGSRNFSDLLEALGNSDMKVLTPHRTTVALWSDVVHLGCSHPVPTREQRRNAAPREEPYLVQTFPSLYGDGGAWIIRSALKYCRSWLEALHDSFPQHATAWSLKAQLSPFLFLVRLGQAGVPPSFILKIQKFQTSCSFAIFMNQTTPALPKISDAVLEDDRSALSGYFAPITKLIYQKMIVISGKPEQFTLLGIKHMYEYHSTHPMDAHCLTAFSTIVKLGELYPAFYDLAENEFPGFNAFRVFLNQFKAEDADSCFSISVDKPEQSRISKVLSLPFTGKTRNFLLDILCRKSNRTSRNMRFMNTVLQGIKRGCESAPVSVVNASKRDQMKILGQEKPLNWDFSEDFEKGARKISRQFKPRAFQIREASTSAAFGANRSTGGAREKIREGLGLGQLGEAPLEQMSESVEVKISSLMAVSGVKDLRDRTLMETSAVYARQRHQLATELSGIGDVSPAGEPEVFLAGDIQYLEDLKHVRNSDVNPSFGPTEPFVKGPDEEWNALLGERPAVQAQVEAILEPLKVRLITKSCAFRQWLSGWFQKELHSFFRSIPQFRLIGEPLDSSHLYWLLEKTKVIFPDVTGFKWESGDYAAATDQLSLEATKTCFEYMLSRIRFEDKWMVPYLRDILYEQEIHAKILDEDTGRNDPFNGLRYLQRNGQLMGSVVSFPILCMANFICFWKALESYLGRTVPTEEVPCLINGDDFLALMPAGLRRFWVQNVLDVGFRFSIGKNYTDARFLLINSTLYHFDIGKEIFTKVPFLNLGLLTGQSKIADREGVKLSPLGPWYETVINGSLTPSRIHKRFMHYHRDNIATLTQKGTFNLFLPLERGGLGFPSDVLPESLKVTNFQRRYARFISKALRQPRSELDVPGLTWTLKGLNQKPSYTIKQHKGIFARVTLEPLIGPLPEGAVTASKSELSDPLLSGLKITGPEDALAYVPPKKKHLQRFRRSKNKKMSVADCLVGYRVVGFKVEPEMVPGDSESLPPSRTNSPSLSDETSEGEEGSVSEDAPEMTGVVEPVPEGDW